jgi:hypothetical protein
VPALVLTLVSALMLTIMPVRILARMLARVLASTLVLILGPTLVPVLVLAPLLPLVLLLRERPVELDQQGAAAEEAAYLRESVCRAVLS